MEQKNLFSIGEIAKALGVTRKIILNYEAKGLIRPDKKEGASGNRYYTIDTFTQIRTIRVFQNLGLSLDEIRTYFQEDADLAPAIHRLETMRDELVLMIEKLKERMRSEDVCVEEIVIPPQTVYVRTYDSATVAEKTDLLRNTALEAMRLYGTDITKRMYFVESSVHAPTAVSYCVAVPSESEGENVVHLPQMRAIAIFHHGPYEKIPAVREKLAQHAKENGLTLSGTFRSLFLEGPPQHKDPGRFITQIIAILS